MPDRFASEILAFGRRRNRAVLCIDHTEPQGVDKSQSNRHCSTAVSVVGGGAGTAVSGGAAPIRSGSVQPDRARSSARARKREPGGRLVQGRGEPVWVVDEIRAIRLQWRIDEGEAGEVERPRDSRAG